MSKIKTMTDHNGFTIPLSVVPKIDLEKDKFAKMMAKDFEAMSQKLLELKNKAFEKADAIYAEQLRQYQINGNEAKEKKGNFTFYSYDKSIKIEVAVGQRLEFDDRINLAKAEIDDYLAEITEGQNSDIIIIVTNAFSTVKGKLDHKKILNLFTYKIKHPKWEKAMVLLKDSISNNHSKRYINVSQRNENGEYKNINVQFSAL